MEITPELQKMYNHREKILTWYSLTKTGKYLFKKIYLAYEEKIKQKEIELGYNCFRTNIDDVKLWKTQEEMDTYREQSKIVLSFIMCLYKTLNEKYDNLCFDFDISLIDLYRPYINRPLKGFDKEERERLRLSGEISDYYYIKIHGLNWLFNYLKSPKNRETNKYDRIDLLAGCEKYLKCLYLKEEDINEIGLEYNIRDFILFNKDLDISCLSSPFNTIFDENEFKRNRKHKKTRVI